jgi:hypothetical protein
MATLNKNRKLYIPEIEGIPCGKKLTPEQLKRERRIYKKHGHLSYGYYGFWDAMMMYEHDHPYIFSIAMSLIGTGIGLLIYYWINFHLIGTVFYANSDVSCNYRNQV